MQDSGSSRRRIQTYSTHLFILFINSGLSDFRLYLTPNLLFTKVVFQRWLTGSCQQINTKWKFHFQPNVFCRFFFYLALYNIVSETITGQVKVGERIVSTEGGFGLRSVVNKSHKLLIVRVINYLFYFQIYLSLLESTHAIMVPTGKIGPITPRKAVVEVAPTRPFREPAQVWERVDEGPNPYQPPVYKYTLLDFARKHGRKTLIPPPEEEYYKVNLHIILRFINDNFKRIIKHN